MKKKVIFIVHVELFLDQITLLVPKIYPLNTINT